jgi:nitric oxide reductase subunit B
MGVFKLMLPLFGTVFAVGAGVLAYDLLTLGRRLSVPAGMDVHGGSAAVHPATRWGRPLSGFEAGIWLMMMWIFGAIITLGLLSFNLSRVRVEGDPTLPYLLAGVGYPGLLLVTLLFVWRFLASMESRAAIAEAVPAVAQLPAMA